MVINPTYPGVYIQELPSGTPTIQGVATSNTAFVDYFSSGPANVPTQITNFAQFTQVFGGLSEHSEASFAILQYFLNGGQVAYVLRVLAPGAKEAYGTLPNFTGGDVYPTASGQITVTAANAGIWGNNLYVGVYYPPGGIDNNQPQFFNLYVQQWKGTTLVNSETYYNLTMNTASSQYIVSVVNNASALIQIDDGALDWPNNTGYDPTGPNTSPPTGMVQLAHGSTGTVPVNAPTPWTQLISKALQVGSPLETVPVDILCLPITGLLSDSEVQSLGPVVQSFCQRQRAFWIVDPPPSVDVANPTAFVKWVDTVQLAGSANQAYSAIYYPRLTIPDPNKQYRPREVGPSGTVAGIFARTDTNRGVWKAPAGTDAGVTGAQVVAVLTDTDSGNLNPLGFNVIRSFPIYGNVVWGARTLAGANQLQSDYKYVPVRRLTSYIEESLYEGTRWAVFEPNDETLWSSLRLSVGTFMAGLASQGAFYSYVVRCDSTTTTAVDIANGVCNVLVAFAPVKPAEFIVIQIQQLAGQTAA